MFSKTSPGLRVLGAVGGIALVVLSLLVAFFCTAGVAQAASPRPVVVPLPVPDGGEQASTAMFSPRRAHQSTVAAVAMPDGLEDKRLLLSTSPGTQPALAEDANRNTGVPPLELLGTTGHIPPAVRRLMGSSPLAGSEFETEDLFPWESLQAAGAAGPDEEAGWSLNLLHSLPDTAAPSNNAPADTEAWREPNRLPLAQRDALPLAPIDAFDQFPETPGEAPEVLRASGLLAGPEQAFPASRVAFLDEQDAGHSHQVQRLRQAARGLEAIADSLEDPATYAAADHLRQLAAELRNQARQLAATGGP